MRSAPSKAERTITARVRARAARIGTSAGAVGISLSLFPVLRRFSELTSVASLIFRSLEAVFYTVSGSLIIWIMVLSAHPGTALSPMVSSLVTMREFFNFVPAVLYFSTGAFIYSVAFIRYKLVPAWLSIWGIIGVLIIFGVAVFTLFSGPPYAVQGNVAVLAIPIALQEIVLGLYLILKGFRR